MIFRVLTGLKALAIGGSVAAVGLVAEAEATPYTENVPAPTSLPLPTQYPAAGGVAIVLTGVNGNVYYQFSNPTGAFRGFQNNGDPAAFRGNPFTINDPLTLDCGFRDCTDYFGGSIARMDVRFTAYDGDTQPGGFDENDISLIMNGTNIGSWSGIQTEATNTDGTQSFGFNTGFGNGTFDTAWFNSTDPVLLNNILTTGQTTTQVLDDDPNDNYWDFRRGPTLPTEEVRTIAPGYEMTKTAAGGITEYTVLGETITYDYTVTNIGSVLISDVAVFDDKIGNVTCSPTTLEATASGQPESSLDVATCQATYIVTQDDIDAGELTNIANATGQPFYGSLGPLEAEVTLTGPTLNSTMTVVKEASPTSFSTVGEEITYTFTVTNTGNSTLSDVELTDPKIPSLTCEVATLAPPPADIADTQLVCTGSYTVTQDDIDDFAISGNTLDNTATATATDPNGANVGPVTGSASVNGPVAAPAMEVSKIPNVTEYTAAGQTIEYSIVISNTGNVTWPNPPAIVDALTDDEACPAGPVPPGGAVTCTATYDIDLDDMGAVNVLNTVDASITVNGVTATGTASAVVTPVVETELAIVKTLESGANPITSDTDELVYSYELTNNGNTRLDSFAVIDDKVDVVCPVVTLDPGQTVTCSSVADPYDVTQQDVDDGGVTNVASATALTPQGALAESDEVSLFVPADQDPALDMAKTTDPDPFLATSFTFPGTVVYVYTVTNSGNTTITDPVTVTDSKFTDPIPCPAGAIAPGDSIECRATYDITPADITAGNVTNAATASDGNVTSNSDTVTVPQAGAPGITLLKEAITADYNDLTDTITYRFTVTNSGLTPISEDPQVITIADPLIGDFTCPVEQPAILLPTESFVCEQTYGPVTQQQIDDGEIINIASASFEAAGNTVASPSSSATVTSNVMPGLTLVKTPSTTEFDTLNQTVTYTFTVTNDSAQTLSSVVITDPLVPGFSCTITDLGPSPAQDTSCTVDYMITQADLDLGTVVNTAEAVGTTPTGATVDDTGEATITIDPAAATYILGFDKTSDVSEFDAVGDIITYALEVSNDGNLTLENVQIVDPDLGLTCTIGTLAPGASDDSCVGTYEITQIDLDNGSYNNEATATADNAVPQMDDITVNAIDRVASFDFTKAADGPFVQDGDTVTFTLSIENTGDVTLTDVVIEDDFFDPDLVCNIASLPVNTTDSTCVGTYMIEQADVDAGQITNTATVNADGVDGASLPEETATVVVDGPVADPAFEVTKAESNGDADFGAVGTTTEFDFSVTNTGNVTLTGVTISDPTAFFVDEVTPFSCDIADLAPGDTTTTCIDGTTPLVGYVPITQAMVDAGGLQNIVSVDATPPSGIPFTETANVTLGGPDQLPVLTMVKTALTGADFTDVGDEITYEYVITNSQNITLTSPITVVDDKTTVTCPTANPGPPSIAGGQNELAVGATLTCTATYSVTQEDLDTGSVTNVATASINQPVVPSTTYPDGIAAVESNEPSVMVTADQMPSIGIEKAIAPGTSSTYAATTDVVTFQFTVTNTGNVTLKDTIYVDDANIPALDIICHDGSGADVAPGESVVCTAPWSPTQQQIDDGSFMNSATADTTFDAAPVVTSGPPATAEATAIQTPAMEMVKSLVALEDNLFETGKDITYNFAITNTGNVTMVGPIQVVDSLIGTFECSPNDLAPTDPTLNCTAIYEIKSEDVALGSVTNVAYSVDANGEESPPTSVTIPEEVDPSMDVQKEANVATFSAVGDEIIYTYTVTNDSAGSMVGGVLVRPSFEEDIFINDDKFPNPIPCNPINTGTDPMDDDVLSAGEFTICMETYIVTQDDLDAVQSDGAGELESAFVTNNATGSTMFGTVNVLSPPATVTVTGEALPSLAVSKDVTANDDPDSSAKDPASAGDVLTYTITTVNDGNQTMSNVVVTDPMLGALTCTIDGAAATAPFTLNAPQPVPPANPATTVVCTGTYTVLQTDIDNQSLTNTATAEGASPDGTVITETGEDDHLLDDDAPAVEIEKALSDGEPGSAFTTVGEPVEFTMTVRNIGNVTLDTIDVTDSLVDDVTCTIGPLAPTDQDATCTFIYEIKQEDINNGGFTNTGTAVATPDTPDGTPVDDTDTFEASGPEFEPSLTVDKTANVTDFDSADDEITYTYVIANTGNVTIFDQPTLVDDKIGTVSCPAIPTVGLLPLEFITCTATYDVQQEDVDNGGVTNIATVTAPNQYDPANPTLEDVAELTIDSVRTPSFTVVKQADPQVDVVVGQTITYSYTVRNTGNVTLEPIQLVDAHTSDSGTANLVIENGGVIASLEPDAEVTLEGEYLVTQGDIDAGAPLTNTVTGTATPPTGTVVDPVTADESVTVAEAMPVLDVVKTVDPASGTMVGEDVIYTITVANTGNVTLFDVALTDSIERLDGTAISPDPAATFQGGDAGIAGALDVTDTWTYEVRHEITQEDIDAGGLSNQATATAVDELNNPAEDTSGTASETDNATPYIIPAMPAVVGLKTITSSTVLVDETVVFEITIENTGNVTLNSVAVATDTLTRADGTSLALTTGPDFVSADMASSAGYLLVDETATYRATYVLQQDDIDAGGIANIATVTGSPPVGDPVTDVTDDDAADEDDPTTLMIDADPELSMVKSLASGGPTFDTLNQELVFEFEVTNEGNVTLTDPISITDSLIPTADITCDPVPLAPEDSLTCSGSYFVTQDDLDNGSVLNVASATDGTTTSPDDSVEVFAVQNPSLSMAKDANPMPTSAEFFAGAIITYRYTVTNDGNVTVTDPITISDNKIDASNLSCDALPAGGLLPTQSIDCQGTYVVNADDASVNTVTNNATASSGDIESPSDSETIPLNGVPALTIIKELSAVNGDAGITEFSAVGDVLTYTFTVQNTGEVTFGNDIFINDPKLVEDPLLCFTSTPAFPDLTPATGPRSEYVCPATGSYVIDQDDLDAGEVVNEASATTTFGDIPTNVASPVDTETTPAATDPEISILKEVATLPVNNVEQMLTYTLTITNEGNQTLSNVVAVDALLPDLVCEVDELAVDGELVCSADYEVTQDDVDNGVLINEASVTARDPMGGEVEDETSLSTDMPDPEPSFILTKSATPDPFGAVGSGITYTFSVYNNGKVTLSDVVITDAIVDPAFTCTVAELAVGATDATCTLAYTVTQDDVDAGEVTNLATATATDPFDTEVESENEITTEGPDPMPSLVAVKTADFGGAFPESITTYTLTVTNTGNVTLTAPSITDTMTRLNTQSSPTSLTTPFVYQSGDTDLDGFLDVDEVWTYTATYELGQADVNAGGIRNSVVVTADDPNGTEVTDTSDDGDPTDGNTVDDPTVIEIEPGPAIGTEKVVDTPASAVGETAVFLITATNLGNVTLDSWAISDTLLRADGTTPIGASSGPTLTSGNGAGIGPGESWVWRYEYTITQEDIDAGGLTNTATVSGTDPNDVVVSDVSDDGDNSDGNQTDDVTELLIEPTPDVYVLKSVFSTGDAAGETVEFDVTVFNTGNVTLSDLEIVDTMANGDGDSVTPTSVTVTAGSADTLPVDGFTTWRVTYELTQADIDSGSVTNSAAVTGNTPVGVPVSDLSDPDNSGGDAPTVAPITQIDSMEATKVAGTPTRISPDVFELVFEMTVTNTGNVTQTGLVIDDDLAAFLAPATLVGVNTPVISGFETGTANAGYDGLVDVALVSADTSLAPSSTGAVGTMQLTIRYDVSNGFPAGANTVSITSDRIATAVEASTTAIASEDPDILATKTATPERALVGDVVTYTLTFQNRLTTAEANLTLVDELPAGLSYVPNSATYNGAATPAPVLTGRTLQWSDVTLEAGETVALTLEARITDSGLGDLTNQAYVLDPSGARVSNIATAVVRIPVEAVFDCADIIGKVFDDRNMNGYQDGLVDDGAISDQSYDGGKFGIAPVIEEGGEPGIPNVRLSTVTGTIITTDEHGRFSVPCAELPADIGSNFTLKLDDRSLPSGYQITTENPRVIRVTPGTMARLNFGATIATVVDIDLLDSAFQPGSAQPSAGLVQGVGQLVAVLEERPSVLRLTYYRGAESRELARQRLDVLEQMIRDAWRGNGGRRLPIERAINRLQ